MKMGAKDFEPEGDDWLASNTHTGILVRCRRAAKELYVAEIDGKLLMKMGGKDFEPEGDAWKLADKGDAWAIWLRA